MKEDFGALVISLDFELLWGMRDICEKDSSYLKQIYNVWNVIPQILDMFESYNIAATWGIVGLLFAKDSFELQRYIPLKKTQYSNSKLNPYDELLDEGKLSGPLYYAPQLINQIQRRKRQEIATHTFSHYYCLEEGQTRETFAADLNSALTIAKKSGIEINSIIFPRHQYNSDYDDILLERGIKCYRGIEKNSMYQIRDGNYKNFHKRLYRLLDSYINLSGRHLISWDEVIEDCGLCNISSSRFLRPFFKKISLINSLKLQRIKNAMLHAAKTKKIFHLWWHPHNFGANTKENLRDLEKILSYFKKYEKQFGMVSLNMIEASAIARILKKNRS